MSEPTINYLVGLSSTILQSIDQPYIGRLFKSEFSNHVSNTEFLKIYMKDVTQMKAL